MAYRGIFDIHIVVDNFINVMLFSQGLYFLKIRLYSDTFVGDIVPLTTSPSDDLCYSGGGVQQSSSGKKPLRSFEGTERNVLPLTYEACMPYALYSNNVPSPDNTAGTTTTSPSIPPTINTSIPGNTSGLNGVPSSSYSSTHGGSYMSKEGFIDGTDQTYNSRIMYIKYEDQSVDLNEACDFRLELDAKEVMEALGLQKSSDFVYYSPNEYLSTKAFPGHSLYMEVDLMYYEYSTKTTPDTSCPMASVATDVSNSDCDGVANGGSRSELQRRSRPDWSTVRPEKFSSVANRAFKFSGISNGIHEVCQVTFDETHCCIATILVHSCLWDMKFRMRPLCNQLYLPPRTPPSGLQRVPVYRGHNSPVASGLCDSTSAVMQKLYTVSPAIGGVETDDFEDLVRGFGDVEVVDFVDPTDEEVLDITSEQANDTRVRTDKRWRRKVAKSIGWTKRRLRRSLSGGSGTPPLDSNAPNDSPQCDSPEGSLGDSPAEGLIETTTSMVAQEDEADNRGIWNFDDFSRNHRCCLLALVGSFFDLKVIADITSPSTMLEVDDSLLLLDGSNKESVVEAIMANLSRPDISSTKLTSNTPDDVANDGVLNKGAYDEMGLADLCSKHISSISVQIFQMWHKMLQGLPFRSKGMVETYRKRQNAAYKEKWGEWMFTETVHVEAHGKATDHGVCTLLHPRRMHGSRSRSKHKKKAKGPHNQLDPCFQRTRSGSTLVDSPPRSMSQSSTPPSGDHDRCISRDNSIDSFTNQRPNGRSQSSHEFPAEGSVGGQCPSRLHLGELHQKIADSLRRSARHLPNQHALSVEDLKTCPVPEYHPVLFEQRYTCDEAVSSKSSAAHVSSTLNTAPARGVHLVVLIHGFQGSGCDMRLIKQSLLLCYSDLAVLCSDANQDLTDGDIGGMGLRLAQEVTRYVEKVLGVRNLAKLSFVGHSLGGVVARAALSHLERFEPFFHSFVSFSSPHLGYMHSPNKLIHAGMWFLKKWRKSVCLQQLTMSDSKHPRNTYMFKLSQIKGLELFKHVCLFSSYQDTYAPYDSARIELRGPHSRSTDSSQYSSSYREMAGSMVSKIKPERMARVDINFRIPEKTLDALIGRAAHIQFLENQSIMSMIMLTYDYLFS